MGKHADSHASHGHGHEHGHGHGHGDHAHHDHHHEPPFRVPDYKEVKIDGIKDLDNHRQKLAAKGLRDPWIRNEAWRYNDYPGVAVNVWRTVFRGFKWAAGAMIITILADKFIGIGGPIKYAKDQHHHDEAHGAGGHH